MAKSVLIAGPRGYGYTEKIAHPFRSSGYDVHLCLIEAKCGPFDRQTRCERRKVERFNSDIRSCVSSYKFDMAVIVKGDKVYSPTLHFVRSHVKRLILFLYDSINRSILDLSILRHFDNVLLFEKSDEVILQEIGIPCVFYGTPVSTHDYYPTDMPSDSIDISFVGAISKARLPTIKAIIKSFPELNIKIYGVYGRLISPGWLWANVSIKKCRQYFMNRVLTHSEINTLYNSSRICLNIQHAQSQWGCNPRTFEILAARRFQIASSNPYLESEFRHGGLVTYRDNDDLMDKIRYYLANTDERRRHAEIGYRYVQQHSYENKFFLFEQ